MLKTSRIYFVFSINIFWISSLFKSFYSFFILVNGPQALYVNPGCLKCISGVNLSLANKNLFTISFILYLYKLLLIRRILLKDELGTNCKPLASCPLINVKFLPLETAQLCLYSENIWCNIFFAYKLFNLFWNMFNSKAIKICHIITIHIQSYPMTLLTHTHQDLLHLSHLLF